LNVAVYFWLFHLHNRLEITRPLSRLVLQLFIFSLEMACVLIILDDSLSSGNVSVSEKMSRLHRGY